jgi:hypothetical protein
VERFQKWMRQNSTSSFKESSKTLKTTKASIGIAFQSTRFSAFYISFDSLTQSQKRGCNEFMMGIRSFQCHFRKNHIIIR